MKKIALFLIITSLFIPVIIEAQTTLPSSESFETGFGIWKQATNDNLDWTRWSGPTPTDSTGPDAAYDGDYYIYIESDPHNYNPAHHADLVGFFDFTGTTYPMISFYYNMYGEFINYLEIKISTDSTNWTLLDRIIGNQGQGWHRKIICLNNYADTDTVYIVFSAYTSGDSSANATRSDIAIDKIQLVDFKFVDTTITDVSCGGYSDGSINVAVKGGFAPFEYTIDGGTNYTTPSSDTVHLFSGLSGGAYFTKVRSAGTCVMSAGYLTVNEPPKPDIVVDTQYIKPCVYSNNGEIHISVSNGDAPLSYSITGPSGTFVSSPDFTGLDSGYYHVAVKDGKGCIYDQGQYKIDPLYPIIITDIQAQDVNTCYGDSTGSINVQATGGYGTLTYSIDTGNTYEPDGYFPNLPADTYVIFLKDLNGCVDTTPEITINQPAKVVINNITKQDVTTCYGDSTGYIDISASGGSGGLKYSINGGNSYLLNSKFDSLPAGDYYVMVSDSNNCTDGPDTVTITQPPKLVIDSVKYTNVTGCYGDSSGTIEIYAKGGTPTLQYSIDNGQNFKLLNYFDKLPAGTYYPYVKDGSNCIVTAPQITITQPPKLTISSIATTNIQKCYGDSTGQIIIYAVGGTSPISYSIDTGTTVQSSNLFDSLPAGTYRPFVQDANGCKDTGNAVTLTQPTQITITDQAWGDVKCYQTETGWIYVNATGGTGSLLYSIDSGSVFNHNIGDTISVYAGNYNIAVQDENGCTVFGSQLTVNEPPLLAIDSVVVQDVNTCYGDSTGKITIYASGGTPPYQYSIDGGATLRSSNVFDSLPSGTNYSPFIIDANGCIKTSSNVSIAQPSPVHFVDISKADIDTCHGVPIGQISIQVAGGTAPYQYSIDSGQNFVVSSNFNNLYAGRYYITVKDDHDCQIWYSQPIDIIQPDTLVFDSLTYRNITCNGLQDGQITVFSHGGKGPYSYHLINLNTNDTITSASYYFPSLSASSYQVQVQDYYNCRIDTQVTITEPPALVLDSVSYQDVQTCYGDSTGVIKIYAHGGTAPIKYSYAIIGRNLTQYYDTNVFNVPAGFYYTGIIDSMGCTQTSQAFTIHQPDPVYLSSYQTTPITCHGDNNATILINAQGGTGQLYYSIDSGQTWSVDSLFINLIAGTYHLRVKDQRNCYSSQIPEVTIKNPDPLIIDTIVAYDVKCYGSADGHIVIIARGGTDPLQYSIDSIHFQSQNDFYNLDTGIYVGYVVDANGCSASDTSRYITQPPNYAEFTVDTNQGCAPLNVRFLPIRPENTTFSWEFGDLTSSRQTSPLHIFHNQSGSPVTYTVSVKAYHGLCTDTASMPITVYPQPTLDITIDSVVSFYPDTIVEFTNNSPAYYTDYTWDYGDGTVEHIVHPVIHAYPGCGEYNLMVSARNTYYCYDTLRTTINITAFPPTPAFVMSDNDGCAPLTIEFYNSTSDAQSYVWNFGDNTDTTTEINPTHTFTQGGTYMVTLKAIGYCGKYAEISQPVYVYKNPSVEFSIAPDTASVGQVIVFTNKTIGGDYYLWDFGDGETSSEENPRKKYDKAGIYDVKLVATSADGCTDSLTKEDAVVIISDLFVQFPTAFTPDGDGINDYFKPIMNYVKYAKLSIYDRYGNLIFQTDHPESEFWDGNLPNGKPLPSDVYVWHITGMFINGQGFDKSGEVTLLR